MRIFVEDTSGNRFEANIDENTPLNVLAADFFEDRKWSQRDRAVVELVNSTDPSMTERLKGEETLESADIGEGATLRIFPEAIAANSHIRVARLVADHRDMRNLVKVNDKVKFDTNTQHAPTEYKVTFHHRSFIGLEIDGQTPIVGEEHRALITLHYEYPKYAPRIIWQTKIWHPNINSRGLVCLGSLRESYLPGFGLAKIVKMLEEMLRWRNFNFFDPLNTDAAIWSVRPENRDYITEIGGTFLQGPLNVLQDPGNWGDNPNDPQSPMRGIAPPPELEIMWQIRNTRPKIAFKKIPLYHE